LKLVTDEVIIRTNLTGKASHFQEIVRWTASHGSCGKETVQELRLCRLMVVTNSFLQFVIVCPIENVWGQTGNQVRGKGCQSVVKFCLASGNVGKVELGF
jgi:hypothetical protein